MHVLGTPSWIKLSGTQSRLGLQDGHDIQSVNECLIDGNVVHSDP